MLFQCICTFSLLMFSVLAPAADPATSVYSRSADVVEKNKIKKFLQRKVPGLTDDGLAAMDINALKNDVSGDKRFKNLTEDEIGAIVSKQSSGWRFFSFEAGADPLMGSVSLQSDGNTQAVQVNPLNYNLWLGGNIKIPFQLLLTGNVAENVNTTDETEKANSKDLMDAEAGAAVRFPVYLIYQGAGTGICNFGESSIGRCVMGGDITFNTKNLDKIGGGKESAYGYAARLGVSLIFPVLGQSGDESDNANQGYLALASRAVFARSNLDDPSLLFTPVTDASGNPVAFKESVAAMESELKFSINQKISIAAKWFTPLNNKDYLKTGFTLSLENKF